METSHSAPHGVYNFDVFKGTATYHVRGFIHTQTLADSELTAHDYIVLRIDESPNYIETNSNGITTLSAAAKVEAGVSGNIQ